jgi:hypothetical protein
MRRIILACALAGVLGVPAKSAELTPPNCGPGGVRCRPTVEAKEETRWTSVIVFALVF